MRARMEILKKYPYLKCHLVIALNLSHTENEIEKTGGIRRSMTWPQQAQLMHMHMTSQTKVVQSKGRLAEGHITMHNIKQGWVHRQTKIRSLSVSCPELDL